VARIVVSGFERIEGSEQKIARVVKGLGRKAIKKAGCIGVRGGRFETKHRGFNGALLLEKNRIRDLLRSFGVGESRTCLTVGRPSSLKSLPRLCEDQDRWIGKEADLSGGGKRRMTGRA